MPEYTIDAKTTATIKLYRGMAVSTPNLDPAEMTSAGRAALGAIRRHGRNLLGKIRRGHALPGSDVNREEGRLSTREFGERMGEAPQQCGPHAREIALSTVWQSLD